MEESKGKKFWEERWVEHNTPWDLGGPHPKLSKLIAAANERGDLKAGARFHVPGSGKAHDAYALAQMGYQVVASDLVEEAVEQAKALYQESDHLSFAVHDALTCKEPLAFDAIFDRAMLCALPDKLRGRYVASCAESLKPGGLFLSIGFSIVGKPPEQGPPFAVLPQEYVKLWSDFGHLLYCEEYDEVPGPGVIQREALLLFRRT